MNNCISRLQNVLTESFSAKAKQHLQHKRAGSSGGTSGLSSSLVFTPVQGLELVDPESARAKAQKLKDLNAKWFASNAQFVNAKKE
jgi:U4/U6 small nuclear ribonucleoprotein PRP31